MGAKILRLVADHRNNTDSEALVGKLLSQLLRNVSSELAVALGFFGWPLLTYSFHDSDLTVDSVWHRRGSMNPSLLVQELHASERDILDFQGERGEMAQQVLDLQKWREEMQARMQLLEKDLAWKVLGINQTSDISAIGKAFKRRALELHPDKGGDHEQFQLLQDMKGLLIPDEIGPRKCRKPRSPRSRESADYDTDEEIEELIRARRKVEAFSDTVTETPKTTLFATRVKLHQAVLQAWDRFKALGKKLAQFEPHPDRREHAEIFESFQKHLNSFMAENKHGTGSEVLEQFRTDDSDVVLAATLLDARAAFSLMDEVLCGATSQQKSHLQLGEVHKTNVRFIDFIFVICVLFLSF